MKSERPIKVAPSVLAADFGSLGAEIEDVENNGADLLHIDVMDGHFVPPISFGDLMVRTARAHSSLFLDVHLMISHPEHHIDSFFEAGSDRIIFHIEASPHPHYLLSKIKAHNISNGIAINPGTPVEAVFELLDICDLVLIMTVNPGWGGQSFLENSVKKIKRLKDEITLRGLSTLIEVDGGINRQTGAICCNAGADILVAGSSVFRNPDRGEAIRTLRSCANIQPSR